MLQLRNRTGLAGMLVAAPDADGVDTLYAILKGTFDIARGIVLAEKQVPVTAAPIHYGDPAKTSARMPSDVALVKPGTDVLLVGSAHAPGGRPTWQMDVSLVAGPVSKTVRVSGDRVWESGAGGATVSWVAPFERMPLVWERAYGGTQETEAGPRTESRNPVGVGFRAKGGDRALVGLPLPNVEDPSAVISSPRDTPPPAGFAPIEAHWEPRRSYAGTYDERWQRERAPFLPADFDARFLQVAPPGMIVPGYLRGGERIDVRGATPSGTLTFALPRARVEVSYVFDSGSETRVANLDTVLIEPDAARVILVWRSALACDKKLLRVREVAVQASPEA
jgi:hypothetical protein